MKPKFLSGVLLAAICLPVDAFAAPQGLVIRLLGQTPGSIAALHLTPTSGTAVETALADDGKSPDVIANDGVLSGNAILADGEYTLKLLHNGTEITGSQLTIQASVAPSDLELRVEEGKLALTLKPVPTNGNEPTIDLDAAMPNLPEGTSLPAAPASPEALPPSQTEAGTNPELAEGATPTPTPIGGLPTGPGTTPVAPGGTTVVPPPDGSLPPSTIPPDASEGTDNQPPGKMPAVLIGVFCFALGLIAGRYLPRSETSSS